MHQTSEPTSVSSAALPSGALPFPPDDPPSSLIFSGVPAAPEPAFSGDLALPIRLSRRPMMADQSVARRGRRGCGCEARPSASARELGTASRAERRRGTTRSSRVSSSKATRGSHETVGEAQRACGRDAVRVTLDGRRRRSRCTASDSRWSTREQHARNVRLLPRAHEIAAGECRSPRGHEQSRGRTRVQECRLESMDTGG